MHPLILRIGRVCYCGVIVLNRGVCPICREEIIGNDKWKYICKNCSLLLKPKFIGVYLIRSSRLSNTTLNDILKASLMCGKLQVVMIDDSEKDNSSIIVDFIGSYAIENAGFNTVNNAPQPDVTAYNVYESCFNANILFGERDEVYNILVAKHHFLTGDDPGLELMKKEIKKALSEQGTKTID